MQKFHEWQAPPALGPAPEVVTDPFLTAFWGITNERIDGWLHASEMDSDQVTQLTGFSGSAGVKEGFAHLCQTLKDVESLKAGEILVASTTSPNWAPAFQKVSACVTDIGGTCCHAAIVAREYGMPAVVGTGYATRAIKTGDKIRVNGDMGFVDIIERAS